MLDWLSGKKTYICIIVAGLIGVIKSLKAAGLPCLQSIPDGAMDAGTWTAIIGAAASFRAAVGKAEK